jgi:hypothetical protein
MSQVSFYHAKAQLYTDKFTMGEKSMTPRCTDEVAGFIMENLRKAGSRAAAQGQTGRGGRPLG